MKTKNFLFNPGWMEPLKGVEVESRWRIFQAVVAYASDATLPGDDLNAIETVSFGYIKADIDRINAKTQDISEKRRAARLSKKNAEEGSSPDKCAQTPTTAATREEEQEIKQEKEPSLPHTPTLKEKEINKEKEEEREGAPSRPRSVFDRDSAKGYSDEGLVETVFNPRNQARLEALAMQMRIGIERLRQMAHDIVGEWAITGRTHDDYGDASSHLIAILRQRASEERRNIRRGDTPCGPASMQKGMLGVDEYFDAQGRRTYNGVTFIPHDALPRPTRGHYWNHTTNEWDNIP